MALNDDTTEQFPTTAPADPTQALPTTAPADPTHVLPTTAPADPTHVLPTTAPADPTQVLPTTAAGDSASPAPDAGRTRPLYQVEDDTPEHGDGAAARQAPQQDQGGEEDESHRVWSAPAAPADPHDLPEAPRRGVRAGGLAWGVIVMLAGVFLIALALVPRLNVPILAITLMAALGVALIVSALFTGRKPRAAAPSGRRK